MKAGVYELNDGSYLGIDLLEILSFPSGALFSSGEKECYNEVYQRFVSLISGYHSLAGNGACAELLWITDQMKNQSVKSRIRMFLVLRQIGKRKDSVKEKLSREMDNFTATLSDCQYGISHDPENADILTGLLEKTDDSCVLGLTKKEKFSASAQVPNSYFYYADIIPNENRSNFADVIAGMSQLENCAVSMQIFPVRLTAGEESLYRNAAFQYGEMEKGYPYGGHVVSDPYAKDPHTVFQYYTDRMSSPLFQYNVLIFGGRDRAKSLAARLASHIQSGNVRYGTADLVCRDLSREKIHLARQFINYPWNLNSRILRVYRNQELLKKIPLVKQMYRIANIVSAEEAASFFKLPVYETGMTAFQESKVSGNREQFADGVVDENNIFLGDLITNDQKRIPIGCPEKIFTRHALIVGTPGTGKTTFSVHLLLQFAQRGIPFLAIEPTKTEYRAMIDSVEGLRIFTPGNNRVSPFIINPFIPPEGVRIEQYIPSLVNAFKAAFSMPSPLDLLFLNAIRTSYTRYGWKDYSMTGDEDVQIFGLYEFILVFKELLESSSYSRDVKSNLQSGGLFRLTSLIEQNSNIYDNINTIPVGDLLQAPTVLELNAIDNAEQKSLIMALLLINICVYTKYTQVGDGKLKNAILIDEAHVLLDGGRGSSPDGSADSQGTTVRALQDMIAEIRSYGTSIIIADQSPTKVSREIVANTDIKVSFRLVQGVEKELIADSINMDEVQKEELSRLQTGEAFVFYSLLESPQLVKTRDIREQEGIRLWVDDEEIIQKNTYWKTRQQMLKPFADCRYCEECGGGCDFKIRADADFVASAAFQKYKKSFRSSEDMKKCIYLLPKLMETEGGRYSPEERRRLFTCARIRLMRKMALDREFSLSEREKAFLFPHFSDGKTETASGNRDDKKEK